jgi:hypothetical protein
MATLAPGEPGRLYALGGIARGGATRAGYVPSRVFIAIDGVQVGFSPDDPNKRVLIEGLTITDILDESPNKCTCRVKGFVPTTGQPIRLTLGSKNSNTALFAGHILDVNQVYVADKPANVIAEVSAVDYTWLFSFTKVTARYANQSATAIVQDLVSRFAGINGFTSRAVVAGLPVLDEITFTNEDLGDAVTRVARRIGAYWYVDYHRDVHLFFDEVGNGAPVALTPTHPSLAHFVSEVDRSQALTRVYVEGRGSRLLSHVTIGDTMLPLDTVEMFSPPAADVFLKASFQGSEGGAAHLSYTAAVQGGAGSLVGPGIGPPGAPVATPTIGTGLSVGRYQYAYTDVTAAGETLPSPVAVVDIGLPIAAPSTPPTITPLSPGGGISPGIRQWAYTFTTAGGGETTPSPASTTTDNRVPITPTGGIESVTMYSGGVLPLNTWYGYRVTYVGDGGGETTAATATTQVVTTSDGRNKPDVFVGNGTQTHPWATIPAGVTQVKFYRSTGAASPSGPPSSGPFYYVGIATVENLGTPYAMAHLMDVTPEASLGPPVPTINTALATMSIVRVYLATGSAEVTGRKLYRTAAGGTSLQLVGPIANNVDTYADDSQPDSVLGAAPPTTNTAGHETRAVNLSNIAPGPPNTTARKIYRTVAGGAQLKLQSTLADNVTTTASDTLPDASLGTNAPTGDTSGFLPPDGQVAAGSPTMLVGNPGAFASAGGWVVIGNGEQVVRYTAISGPNLTGIPPTGIGAITATIAYGSTVTAAPMLTGIPASGPRSIQGRALTAGDEIYLVVQVDDTAAQAQLADDMNVPSGIREEWVQDRRLSIAEARARGQATLKARPLDERRISYTCRDLRTSSGKTITVSLPAPTNVSGTFKAQQVTISNFRPYPTQYPTYAVQASSARYSFEDLLRQVKAKE